MDMQHLRDRMLLAALPHIAFDGWTMRALETGLDDAEIDKAKIVGAFPGGITDLVAHFSDWADREMLTALEGCDLEAMRVRDRVVAGVRLRLEALAPHREAVRRGLSVMMLPQNAVLAARLSFNTVNAIWYAAGDRSADFNYYTKRGLLAPVYATTVLYWLADQSDDFADTWDYLERRIGDVLKIPVMKTKLLARLKTFNPVRGGRRSLWSAMQQLRRGQPKPT